MTQQQDRIEEHFKNLESEVMALKGAAAAAHPAPTRTPPGYPQSSFLQPQPQQQSQSSFSQSQPQPQQQSQESPSLNLRGAYAAGIHVHGPQCAGTTGAGGVAGGGFPVGG